MKIPRWIVLGITVCLLTALWPPRLVIAASPVISGRASTVFEWYKGGKTEDKDKTATPFYQYLLFNVKDLDGNGLNFRSYGRLGTDLSNVDDSADSRLYYGYLEKRDVIGSLDMKLGRQFVATTAGASMMDGAWFKYKDLGPVSVSLFGGGDVAYYKGYNAEDLIMGTEVAGTFAKDLHLGLSYLQKREEGDLSHELLGLNADYDIKETLELYTETQFNYLADEVSYFLGGATYHLNPVWSLRGEYLYSLPVFSASSIYSVFATSEYEEVMAELDYKWAVGLHSFLRYNHEIYEEMSDADVFEIGLEKIRTNKFSGYVSAVLRNDEDGQDLRGFKVHGAYMVLDDLQCGVGADVDVLERNLDETVDETTSQRYWLDADYAVTKTINVQAKLEEVTSQLWSNYYRGQIRLNVRY